MQKPRTPKQKLVAAYRQQVKPWLHSDSKKPLTTQVKEARDLWRIYDYHPVQYFRARLYETDSGDITAYLPNRILNLYREELNSGLDWSVVRNKNKFGAFLEAHSFPHPKTLFSVSDEGEPIGIGGSKISQDDAKTIVQNHSGSLFLKHIEGGGGRDALVWMPDMDVRMILERKSCIVQEKITQHSVLETIYDKAVSTVRLDTYFTAGSFVINSAVLRVGANNRIVDNGGLTAPLDLETGQLSRAPRFRVETDPYLTNHSIHPDTGVSFEGLVIPYWREIIDLAKCAAEELLPIRTLGWDIAVTPMGPTIIETNEAWEIAFTQQHVPLAHTVLGEHALEFQRTGICPD